MLHVFCDVDDGIFHEEMLVLECMDAGELRLQLALHLFVVLARRPGTNVELIEGVVIWVFAKFPAQTVLKPLYSHHWEDDLVHVELEPGEVFRSRQQHADPLILRHEISKFGIALENFNSSSILH